MPILDKKFRELAIAALHTAEHIAQEKFKELFKKGMPTDPQEVLEWEEDLQGLADENLNFRAAKCYFIDCNFECAEGEHLWSRGECLLCGKIKVSDSQDTLVS